MPLCWAFLFLMGCCSQSEQQTLKRDPISQLPWGTTIAVAPALNFSGSSAFDPMKVGDLMASELSEIPGVRVIGVTRVMAILAEQGCAQIASPEHALQVNDRLGADAMLVFAVTEYDPYRPVVGLAAQLYGRGPHGRAVDPLASLARPFPVPPGGNGVRPWAEVQRTFNGLHEDVQKELREYADDRHEQDSPYGWRKFLASQEWYLRFCCFQVGGELVQQPPCVMATGSQAQEFGS